MWKINSFNRESKGRSSRSYLHFLYLTTIPLPVPTPSSLWNIVHRRRLHFALTLPNFVMNTFWHCLWMKHVLLWACALGYAIIYVHPLMMVLYENVSKLKSPSFATYKNNILVLFYTCQIMLKCTKIEIHIDI